MLDEAPETLILSAIEGFETQPDVASIGRINELANRVNELWQEEENRLETEVSALENDLRAELAEIDVLKRPTNAVFELLHLQNDAIALILRRNAENPEKNDVFSVINEQKALLDKKKILLAKQLSELESRIAQMRTTEMELTQREAELAEQKLAALQTNTSSNMDLTTMKIMLFKKFGIHIEEGEEGKNDKIVIFNEKRSGAKTLEVDPKFLDYFISNYIWEHVGNNEEA